MNSRNCLLSPAWDEIGDLTTNQAVDFPTARKLLPNPDAWRAWLPLIDNLYASHTGATGAEFEFASIDKDGDRYTITPIEKREFFTTRGRSLTSTWLEPKVLIDYARHCL